MILLLGTILAFELTWEGAAAVVGAVAIILGAIATYNTWHGRRAKREGALDTAVDWFTPAGPDEPERETLPEMMRHLIREVAGIREKNDERHGEQKEQFAAMARRHDRFEDQVTVLEGKMDNFEARLDLHLDTEEREIHDLKVEVRGMASVKS